MIVALAPAPLATYGGRTIASVARTKLDVRSPSSRAYVARLDRLQTRVAAQIRRTIPQASIGRRFTLLLDALTVTLPGSRLPALLASPSVAKVYPSLSYTLATNRSPALIGADALRQASGADGRGVKIAVVDDGIDQTNPFFDAAGFSYPAGFPRGDTDATTAKVIVARVFPGPNAGRAGRLPVDPASSFHGTHVAGIAAGVSGTAAPAGSDHPRVTGLSGVAPRAWLGNYRVFTVPTPIGHVANTPEVIAAFEAAVSDGMDVVNFSGGGPQIDPANDALATAVHDLAAAGVVPVISAGNDRDDFGAGSSGSPSTAPDAVAVAATSNAHVFAYPLTVTAADAPAAIRTIAFQGANDAQPPPSWATADQTLVDVGTLTGTDGKPVDRHLCGPPGALDRVQSTLRDGSLHDAIALVERGLCPLDTKARIAKLAGAVGIVYGDNRDGEANVLPFTPAVPGGTVANLDAARLRTYLSTHDGRTAIRVGGGRAEIDTGRSGTITSFSSAGPTPFGHLLGPDVAAPGGQILSSTLPRIDSSRFAVFDGTSMAAPHVSGAVAQLLQLHPAWTPAEVKSALVSTARPAYADTAATREAPVTLEGGGLVAVDEAADPRLFAFPSSLSFGDVAVGSERALLVRLADAGGGDGTWQVEVRAQAGEPPLVQGAVSIAPGGEAYVPVTARPSAAGPSYGFVVLRKDGSERRVPYLFLGSRPLLADVRAIPIRRTQTGDTRVGRDRVERYAYPVAPFGNQPDRPPMAEDGAEAVYVFDLDRPAVNAGVSVLETSHAAQIDPFFLGTKDETTVQGFAGTPVDVNNLTSDYLMRVGAAGAAFPRAGRYYVAVDSGRGDFTGRSLAGRYVLRAWVNDLTPPRLRLLSARVWAGRPTLVVRALDAQSGVDPASLTIGYRDRLVSVASFDWRTGIAVFPLPGSASPLRAGTTIRVTMIASDFQEAKNVDTVGKKLMPNTTRAAATLRVARGATVDWLTPARGGCLVPGGQVEVVAGGAGVRSVRFALDGRTFASDPSGDHGIFRARLPRGIAAGAHTLTAHAGGARDDEAVRRCPA